MLTRSVTLIWDLAAWTPISRCWPAVSFTNKEKTRGLEHYNIAVLSVPGLSAPALTLASDPRSGLSAAILGFPGNGPYDVRAGRLGQTREVITQDAYGRGPVRRSIASLRGAVRSGNSGGPMVDADGDVVTTVFAATTSGPRGGFGVPNAIVRVTLRRARASGGVSTGACAG